MKNIIILIIIGGCFFQCNMNSYELFKLTSFHKSYDYLIYSKYKFQPDDSTYLINIFRCNDLEYKFIDGEPYLKLRYMEEADIVYLTSMFICITGKKIEDLDTTWSCSDTPIIQTKDCMNKK